MRRSTPNAKSVFTIRVPGGDGENRLGSAVLHVVRFMTFGPFHANVQVRSNRTHSDNNDRQKPLRSRFKRFHSGVDGIVEGDVPKLAPNPVLRYDKPYIERGLTCPANLQLVQGGILERGMWPKGNIERQPSTEYRWRVSYVSRNYQFPGMGNQPFRN